MIQDLLLLTNSTADILLLQQFFAFSKIANGLEDIQFVSEGWNVDKDYPNVKLFMHKIELNHLIWTQSEVQ